MEKFTTLRAIAAPYPTANVDTDLIIRIERCASVPRGKLGPWAFEMARYRPDGSENPEFVFNRPPWRKAGIIVAAENFGTGSSREMAVWALADMGIRCVIAPSFGEIFHGNCFQNGLLAIRLPGAEVEKLMALAADPATAGFSVDLERQRINEKIPFEISPRRKRMLLEGLDEIGLTRAMDAQIAGFQAEDRAKRPWIYLTR
jgi:3-isopropylmalate/(R)-2-methylmalate dehydratase small subunit